MKRNENNNIVNESNYLESKKIKVITNNETLYLNWNESVKHLYNSLIGDWETRATDKTPELKIKQIESEIIRLNKRIDDYLQQPNTNTNDYEISSLTSHIEAYELFIEYLKNAKKIKNAFYEIDKSNNKIICYNLHSHFIAILKELYLNKKSEQPSTLNTFLEKKLRNDELAPYSTSTISNPNIKRENYNKKLYSLIENDFDVLIEFILN